MAWVAGLSPAGGRGRGRGSRGGGRGRGRGSRGDLLPGEGVKV